MWHKDHALQMAPLVRPFFESDFTIGHIDWGLTSQFAIFDCHLLSTLFRTILLTFRVTQVTALLHAGSLVSCHNFLIFLLCFNRRSRPAILYFRSKIVVLLVDILYAEVIRTAKSRATLSASLQGWIWIFGGMSSETRLWNSSQSVSVSTGSKASLVLTG
jgi:hypothetical protein